MPSKLGSIPANSVSTDALAYALVRKTLKHYDNIYVCEGLLRKANKCDAERKPNRFRSLAYRRAAIVLAATDVNLINEKTDCVTLINQGMPRFGSTTEYALDYIHKIILQEKMLKDPLCIFPEEWRTRIEKEHQLVLKSFVAVGTILKIRNPDEYRKIYNDIDSIKEKDDETKLAFSFYNRMNTQQLNLVKPRFAKYF